MCYHVDLVQTDVSEERIAFIRLVSQSAVIFSRWFLSREFLYPEDVGDTFLRNVGSQEIYTAPHPTRRHYSDHPICEPSVLV
jgi:hypothetical protein